jgi:hypothetical protein
MMMETSMCDERKKSLPYAWIVINEQNTPTVSLLAHDYADTISITSIYIYHTSRLHQKVTTRTVAPITVWHHGI